MSRYYGNRQNRNSSGRGTRTNVRRLYKCFKCNGPEFESNYNAPECRSCGQVLKGKYLGGGNNRYG